MNYLNGTIDRLEGNQAVLKIENGATLLWPTEKLPNGFVEGQAIKLSLLTDSDVTEDKEIIAKNILNEILQSE